MNNVALLTMTELSFVKIQDIFCEYVKFVNSPQLSCQLILNIHAAQD
jgi:hypothetical protein